MLSKRVSSTGCAPLSGRLIRRGRVSQASVAALVLGTILCVLGLMAFEGRGVQARITSGADGLHLEVFSYETDVAYADVDSVVLRPQLQGLKQRLGGMQTGNTYVGQFEVVPFGPTMLFVDGMRKPLIYFFTRKGVVVLTVQDSLAAIALARDVQQRIVARGQR